MNKQRILVVDDEPGMQEVCRDTLARLPETEVAIEGDAERASGRLRAERWDLIVADIRMPRLDGVSLLERARQIDPDTAALMITAYPSVDTAVKTMKLGASDYITKPFRPEDLLSAAERLLEHQRLTAENRTLRRHLQGKHGFDDFIGGSAAMQRVFDRIGRLADTDVDVLVSGETGTGKELVARSLHRRSGRADGPFVPVDCGAIPEQILESELFGHERGAFTGAEARSYGLLEYASGGTFFLDELSSLSPGLQSKLLRALQERRIRRVGGQEEIEVDLRVIAATSVDLGEEVREGRFRSDLFYRVNVGRVDLPPLRDRPEDVPRLVHYFTQRHAKEMGREGVAFDAQAVEVLTAYPWPGNVRELQNVVKRSLALARGSWIGAEDLPPEILERAGHAQPGDKPGFFELRAQRIDAFERQYLGDLLTRHGGDVPAAAEEAKLPRGTLYRLLKKHGLSPGSYR